MSTNKSFSNKSSRQLLTVSEHPPAFAGFLFSLSSFRSSPIYPFLKCVYMPAFFLITPRLFLLPYCPPLQPVPICSYRPTARPFSSCPSATHGSSSPNDTNSLKRYKLPQTVQTLPNGTTSPKRLIHLFCPQHSLKTKIAIEF